MMDSRRHYWQREGKHSTMRKIGRGPEPPAMIFNQ